MAACPNCGKPYDDWARFCSICGTELATEPSPPRELRKTVTVVFSDVANSTRLGERLDPESHRRVMGGYFDAMRVVLERHGGTVEKFIGDAVMAVFGIPVLHEDDALRAVRAALEMQEAVVQLNRGLRRDWDLELSIRTGVNTGEVVAGEAETAQTLVTGDAVVVAKRLEESAAPDEIQLGESTYRLVREAVVAEALGAIEAKGKPRLPAWRLLGMHDWDATAVRLDSPLVGRTADLRALDRFFRARRRRNVPAVSSRFSGRPGSGSPGLCTSSSTGSATAQPCCGADACHTATGSRSGLSSRSSEQAAGLTDRDSADEARTKILALLQPGEDARGSASASRPRSAAARRRPRGRTRRSGLSAGCSSRSRVSGRSSSWWTTSSGRRARCST